MTYLYILTPQINHKFVHLMHSPKFSFVISNIQEEILVTNRTRTQVTHTFKHPIGPRLKHAILHFSSFFYSVTFINFKYHALGITVTTKVSQQDLQNTKNPIGKSVN